MKTKDDNLQNLAAGVLLLLMLFTSCRHHSRTVIISAESNDLTRRIEYSRKVVFNKDNTGIDYFTKNGYLKFEQNGQKIEAERSDNGRIAYRYDGSRTEDLSAEGKAFLAVAVKTIVAEQARQRHVK